MYLRLSQFGDNTNQDWTALVAKLVDQMKKDGKVNTKFINILNSNDVEKFKRITSRDLITYSTHGIIG